MLGLSLFTALTPSLIAMCTRHGISLDQMTLGFGQASQDNAPLAGIGVEEINALFDELGLNFKSPGFFIELGQHISLESLGSVGQAILTAKTAREAISQFNEYTATEPSLVEFTLTDLTLGQTRIEYVPSSEYAFALDRKYQEILMAALAKMMNALHGGYASVSGVCFTYSKPECLSHYERAFGDNVEVLFNQPSCALKVPTAVLDCVLKGSSPEFNKAFVERSRKLLSKPADHGLITGQVIRVIEQKIGYEVFNMDDVALTLSMTPRTLQRRLKQEGTTYAQLRDSVRFQYAEESLRSSSVDMASIAASLGFSEPANFYAAFKRWQGISPGEYRKRFLVS